MQLMVPEYQYETQQHMFIQSIKTWSHSHPPSLRQSKCLDGKHPSNINITNYENIIEKTSLGLLLIMMWL